MWTDFAKTGYKNIFPYFIQIILYKHYFIQILQRILILTANILIKLIFRNPTPSTNLWLSLTGPQNKDYNGLNIDLNLKMETFRYGKERWDWENV